MWQIALILGGVSMALGETQETASSSASAPTLRVYVGTYTGGKSTSKGIALLEMNSDTGALTSKGYAAESASPSFLAIHPTRRFVYSVNEVPGNVSGGVSAFAVNPEDGTLKALNQESSHGAGPCHLVVDKLGKNVLVANYGGGSIAVLPIDTDGRLKPATTTIQHSGTVFDPKRQGGPHAHSINLDAANKFAVVADLGLDKLFVYRFDPEKGTLTPNDPPFTEVGRRAGPRHFTFHPDGRHAYVINEINCTVTALDYDAARGVLTAIGSVPTLPAGLEVQRGDSTAEVQVHPSGSMDTVCCGTSTPRRAL